ncbi:hypothetical protein QUF76_07785 [Desulfobacterales bacterium HSG16]|nr:hypothetical protein [Desulfobacterales bacterium HSG16]
MGSKLMPHIRILKEMLIETAIVPLEDHPYGKSKKQVTLTEQGQYSVTIKGLPPEDQIIVFKTDSYPAPEHIFKGNKGECKRADFVIICNTTTIKMILFIELKAKSNTSKTKHIIQQLKGSQCIIGYSQEIGRLFWDPTFLEDFQYRFVCLTDINIQKRQTRVSKALTMHETPENMLKIKCPRNLQFNQLIGTPNMQ